MKVIIIKKKKLVNYARKVFSFNLKKKNHVKLFCNWKNSFNLWDL